MDWLMLKLTQPKQHSLAHRKTPRHDYVTMDCISVVSEKSRDGLVDVEVGVGMMLAIAPKLRVAP